MVYVDDAEVAKRGRTWFHLVADSVQELHSFATSIGLPRRAFHTGARHPHYDVTAAQRLRAICNGALPIGPREAVLIGRRISSDAPKAGAESAQFCLFA